MTETTTQTTDRPGGTAYRWAPLSEADVPAWAELVNHLARVDGTEEFYREEDLREELTFSGFDPGRDSVAVWDGDVMVAFTTVSVPRTPDHEGSGRGYLDGGVHADHRRRGLGRALLDRMEPRAVELVGERHGTAPAYLRAGGGLHGSSASAMLARRGYRVVRYYNELVRPLDGPVEVPPVEGVTLVSPGAEHEEAVRLAHNDAFRDHWGSGEQSAESWHERWTGRAARGDVSTVALDVDGRALAYVLCAEWVDRELYVNLVGTVRDARGRGLARAALLRTIDLAARSGAYDTIELGVDSENPSGATRLYENVGFTLKHQVLAMQRDLPL
ncbi:GNAT family N-acetyltransferase [Ornithinimicrobium pekingense]|uniref:GNAT family acetyltransferase n=1 Tax=Ornithinimicrobium pekingense TaxID=384677 RepID=A0ABQ2FBF8_9MICO|nr:GNAT family N-acetyltransferase [Ornithinimicrobium pekingense]GGK76020.1 GNAT family acetyltransferase [Ornithinimicrobium pekingense]